MSLDTPQFEPLPGFSPPSTPGPYSADDYWRLPEGAPVELIQGRLIKSSSRTTFHQTVSALLSEYLLHVIRRTDGRAAAAQQFDFFINNDGRHVYRNSPLIWPTSGRRATGYSGERALLSWRCK